MNKTTIKEESIVLTLPVNSAYISAARLIASSIANRLTFNIDEIEDIKSAVSEACTYLIKKLPCNTRTNFQLIFHTKQDKLEIELSANYIIKQETMEKEMSLLMINALMDDCSLSGGMNKFTINMVKNHKQNSFH